MAGGSPKDLHEFLLTAELQHYYAAFVKDLKVNTVPQLKYVEDNDMVDIGMSKPEIRRLRQFFKKQQSHGGAFNKFRKAFSKGDTSPTATHDRPASALGGKSSPSISSPISLSSAPSSSDKHIIPEEALTVYKILGRGEFGVVQQGVWTNDHGEQTQVAVKCLAKDKLQSQSADFVREATIMHSIDHPNIVQLYGIVLGANDSLMLVTELAPLRSLLECLKEPALRGNFGVLMLCDLSSQVADGMAYLESRQLIHRDLAARNILMFSKDKCKISDFGLSRVLGAGKDYYQSQSSTGLKLPIAWCAPECINFLKFTSASDVWSFGVTLWEIFSYGAQPWAGLTSVQIVEAVDAPSFHRLDQPDHCPDEWYSLAHKCWNHEPHCRPRFSDIAANLPQIKPCRVISSRDNLKIELGCNGYLRYQANEFITILSKIPNEAPRPGLWKGVLEHSNLAGFFDPDSTTPFLELSASAPILRKIKLGRAESARLSVRSSRRIDASMIGVPQNDLRHIGHVGYDGAVFGDVAFIGDNYDKLPIKLGNTRNTEHSDMRASTISLPANSSNRTSIVSNQSQPRVGSSISSSTLCGDSAESSHDLDDFGDFELPGLSMNLDLGSSLMDEVMNALTDSDTRRSLMDHYDKTPVPSKNSTGPGLADSEDDDDNDDESSESTAGPSSPNEGNSATESEGEGDGRNGEGSNSMFDSSSSSSHGRGNGSCNGGRDEDEDERRKSSDESSKVDSRRYMYTKKLTADDNEKAIEVPRSTDEKQEESSFLATFTCYDWSKPNVSAGQTREVSPEFKINNGGNLLDDEWFIDSEAFMPKKNGLATHDDQAVTINGEVGLIETNGNVNEHKMDDVKRVGDVNKMNEFESIVPPPVTTSQRPAFNSFARTSVITADIPFSGNTGFQSRSSIDESSSSSLVSGSTNGGFGRGGVTIGARNVRGANQNLRAPQGIPGREGAVGVRRAFINPGASSSGGSEGGEVDTNPLRRLRDSQPPLVAPRPAIGRMNSSERVGATVQATRNLNANYSFFDKLQEQEQQKL